MGAGGLVCMVAGGCRWVWMVDGGCGLVGVDG